MAIQFGQDQLDFIPGYMFLLDEEQSIISMSSAFLSFVHREESQLVGSNFHNLFIERDQEDVKHFLMKAIECAKTGMSDQNLIDARIPLGENKFAWLRILTSVKKAEGIGWQIAVNAFDISRLMETLEITRRSEEVHRMMIEATDDGIWDWDLNTNRMRFSRRLKEMLGYKDEDFQELDRNFELWNQLIYPDDLSKLQERLKLHFESDQPFNLVVRFFTKDRSTRYILVRGYAVRDKLSRPYHMFGSHTDVTDEKRNIERLQIFKQLIDESPDVMAIVSPDGKPIFVNRVAAETLGWSTKVNSLSELLTERGAAEHFNFVLPAIEAGKKVWQSETDFRDLRTSTFVPFDMKTFALRSKSGEVVFYGTTAGDLRPRREVEAKLIQGSKMASLGEMAGGIAHEINNPLAIVMGKAQQIEDELDVTPINSELIKKHVSRILETCERIVKIIKGLRSFARSGEKDPFEPYSMKNLMDETAALCKERYRNHGVELRIPPFEDVQVECRNIQLSQVLVNLMNNAFDAIEKSEQPWVEVLVERSGAEFIKVHVTDSGKGIPKEIADKIMQPFFTTKGVGKGTGIGLSISKGIIEDHQGRLEIDTASANTRFTVTIPIKHVHPIKLAG